MFLVGDFNDRNYWVKYKDVRVVKDITKDKKKKKKRGESVNIINLKTLQFFDPETNNWVDLPRD